MSTNTTYETYKKWKLEELSKIAGGLDDKKYDELHNLLSKSLDDMHDIIVSMQDGYGRIGEIINNWGKK